MPYKFEKLEVWQLSVEYTDAIYAISDQLPAGEIFNLKSQVIRAATSISLNIAEGSTGQTDAEQSRFLGIAIRSLIETVACLHLIRRREYLSEDTLIAQAIDKSQLLAQKLQAFRKTLGSYRVRENSGDYLVEDT